MGYEELEHTADVSLRAWGATLAELFCSAAQGMFALMGAQPPAEVEREVQVAASDLETLLVDWLSELLYLNEVHGELYSSFEVSLRPGWQLAGRACGRRRAISGDKVKAVTYHGLRVEALDGGFSATIVFDT